MSTMTATQAREPKPSASPPVRRPHWPDGVERPASRQDFASSIRSRALAIAQAQQRAVQVTMKWLLRQ